MDDKQNRDETTTTDFILIPNEAEPSENNQRETIEHHQLVIIDTPNQTEEEPQQKKPYKRSMFAASLLIILGGFSIGMGIGVSLLLTGTIFNRSGTNHLQHPLQLPNQDNLVFSSLEPLSMVDAVNRVKPSVVTIDTNIITNLDTSIPFDLPMDFFYNHQIQRPTSGTGIIFDSDDDYVFIVTNEHVIAGANTIEVSITGRASVEATVHGRDISSDLAVISVQKADLAAVGVTTVVTAEFGDSSQMQIGEVVIAIGNALGQGNSTTMGVVSAKNIQIAIEGRSLSVLQTDAAINPGNSGGPLINSRGQVIGINTVKLSRPDVYGMGYSVTSNVAMPIMQDLLNQTGRPLMGIRGSNISAETAYLLGFEEPFGVMVQSVNRNSGAYYAGLIPRDIITSFNGEKVESMQGLINMIGAQQMRNSIELGILRNGDTPMTLELVLIPF